MVCPCFCRAWIFRQHILLASSYVLLTVVLDMSCILKMKRVLSPRLVFAPVPPRKPIVLGTTTMDELTDCTGLIYACQCFERLLLLHSPLAWPSGKLGRANQHTAGKSFAMSAHAQLMRLDGCSRITVQMKPARCVLRAMTLFGGLIRDLSFCP